MSKKKILKNTFIYSIGEIFPKMISFLLLPIFTNYLSTEDYGIISYTNSIMFFLLVISSLALNTYLLREYYNIESEEERKNVIGNVFSTILVFNILLLIVSFVLGPILIKFFNLKIPFYPYFSLSLLNNFFEVLSIIPLVIFRVKENAIGYVLVNSARAALIFLVTYLLIANLDMGVLGNFYGRLIINGIFSLIYFFIVLKNSKLNLNLVILKKALKFSLPLIPGSIGFLLMSMSDRIILERYVSLSDLGIYSVAYTIAFSLSIVIQGGYRSFEPEIYKEYGKDTFDLFIKKLHGLFMLVVFVLAIGLTLFSKELLIIMTKGDFVKGYVLIPIILIGVVATAQNAILGSILIAENKTKISSYATIAGGAISIIFNLFLIPHFGIYSAACATAIAYSIMNIIIINGISIKVKFAQFDLYSLLYFFIICFCVYYFLNDNKIVLSIIFFKIILLIVSVYILLKLYGVNSLSIILNKFIRKKNKMEA